MRDGETIDRAGEIVDGMGERRYAIPSLQVEQKL